MKLILVRHGEIQSNIAKVYSGRSDEPLNETGQAQAAAAADKLRSYNIDAIYSSPLKRALQTAQVVGKAIGRDPITCEAFNELAMGPWEGLSELEVSRCYPAEFGQWNNAPADLCLAGRETLRMLQDRVMQGLMSIGATQERSCIAVVSHVAVIRIIILTASGRPLNDYKKVDVPNATPQMVDLASSRFACSTPAHADENG